MDGVFYWPRIWIGLDEKQRQEIDSEQALVDSALYVSAALFFSALACLAYAAHELLGLGLVRVLPRWEPLVGLAALCVLVGFVLYRGSLHLQRKFGETFRSVFDLYRDRFKLEPVLEEIVAVTGSEALRTAPKRDQYIAVWRYLHNYRVDTPEGRMAPPKITARSGPS